MRTACRTILLLTAASLLACANYRGFPVYGAYRAVSPQDLDEVVAATQKGLNRPDQLNKFQVVSHDEVWVYPYPTGHVFHGSYWIVKRINGRWRCDEISWVIHPHA